MNDSAVLAAMDAALAQAQLAAERGELPYGAVVIDADGRVVAAEHDRVVRDADLTSHGELLVVRQALARSPGPALPGHVLVSTAEPCAMCFSAAWTARMRGVAFGLTMAELRAAVPDSMDEIVIDTAGLNALAARRISLSSGVRRDACLALWTPPAAR